MTTESKHLDKLIAIYKAQKLNADALSGCSGEYLGMPEYRAMVFKMYATAMSIADELIDIKEETESEKNPIFNDNSLRTDLNDK